jgi:hypothetical protein
LVSFQCLQLAIPPDSRFVSQRKQFLEQASWATTLATYTSLNSSQEYLHAVSPVAAPILIHWIFTRL